MYKQSKKGRKDITGFVFNLLKVLFYYDTPYKNARWFCECACGRFKVVDGRRLRLGETKSCGCLNTTHNGSNTRLYRIWKNMMSRALWTNKDNYNYKRYKGRGITVCEEWRTFENFLLWAEVNGYTDELTIERIDNSLGYFPENCKWATRKEQSNNTSTNRFLTFEGKTQTLTQWEEEFGLSRGLIARRLDKYKWPLEKVFSPPKH